MKESFSQQPEPDLSILMQVELLKDHPDWIEAHAEDFRILVDNDPEIVERYKENPKEAINEIEKRFYH